MDLRLHQHRSRHLRRGAVRESQGGGGRGQIALAAGPAECAASADCSEARAVESPSRVAKELPDSWLERTATIVEWATILGDGESARVISERTVQAHPEWTRIAARGPTALPAEPGRDAVVATGRDLVEVLRADMRHFPEYREGMLTDAQLHEAYDLMRRWLTDLTDPAGPLEPISDTALTDVVTRSWPKGTELSRMTIAFEAAAANVRRHRV